MDQFQLKVFLASADFGSFAQAGDYLSLTPPNIMRQINQLEAEIGTPLLKRNSKGVSLTAAGKSFYPEAKVLINMFTEAAALAREASEIDKKHIRLGISAMNPMEEFNQIWRLSPRRNEFFLSMINLPTSVNQSFSRARGSLRETDVDFCSGPVIDQFEDICFLELCSYPLTCAIPINHPLAQKERIELNDLRQTKLLFPARSNAKLCRRFAQYINSKNLEIRLESPSLFYDQQVFNYCASQCIPLISLSCWDNVHPSMINLPVEWGIDISLPYGLIWKKENGGIVDDFIAAIQEGMDVKKPAILSQNSPIMS